MNNRYSSALSITSRAFGRTTTEFYYKNSNINGIDAEVSKKV